MTSITDVAHRVLYALKDAKTYAIRDVKDDTFFQSKPTPGGWYGLVEAARLYKSPAAAFAVIKAGGHHVTYPGNRDLRVFRVARLTLAFGEVPPETPTQGGA